jgi:hypothetical protein
VSQDPADTARWWPGGDVEHFQLHGHEFHDVSTLGEYDASARQTIRLGASFSYTDPDSGVPRVGYYTLGGNRFTALNKWETRIQTHFRPNEGEAYVYNLPDSTYTR